MSTMQTSCQDSIFQDQAKNKTRVSQDQERDLDIQDWYQD